MVERQRDVLDVTRIEMCKHECDRLRMFSAQCCTELLRIRATQLAESIGVGQLPLDALEDCLCLGRAECLVQHPAGHLDVVDVAAARPRRVDVEGKQLVLLRGSLQDRLDLDDGHVTNVPLGRWPGDPPRRARRSPAKGCVRTWRRAQPRNPDRPGDRLSSWCDGQLG